MNKHKFLVLENKDGALISKNQSLQINTREDIPDDCLIIVIIDGAKLIKSGKVDDIFGDYEYFRNSYRGYLSCDNDDIYFVDMKYDYKIMYRFNKFLILSAIVEPFYFELTTLDNYNAENRKLEGKEIKTIINNDGACIMIYPPDGRYNLSFFADCLDRLNISKVQSYEYGEDEKQCSNDFQYKFDFVIIKIKGTTVKSAVKYEK